MASLDFNIENWHLQYYMYKKRHQYKKQTITMALS